MRTAIAGAICAKYLAPKHVKGIGIVGNGIQARMQLEYLSDIVNCKEVYILGRDKSRVERYIDDMNKFDFNIHMVNNSKELCENSNLIVTTTNANESLIFKDDVMKGTHITAVGSDTPDKRELDPEILKMANSLIVDSIPQCLERGETKKALDKDLINEDKLIELGEIIDYGKKYRKDEDEITVADLTGVAVQDIMITNAVYKQLKMEK